MYNSSLECSLRGGGDGCDINWIGDLGDAQNPWRMLLVDIQCFIVHITSQLFECEHLSVINAILELQFTNHNWENCPELLLKKNTWPSVELLNSPRGTVDLHGVYGDGLQQNVWWWCESWCGSRHTPLIKLSKWTIMYCWCSVAWTWILVRSCIRWWWSCRRLMVPWWRSWAQKNQLKWLCVTLYLIPQFWLNGSVFII